MKHVFKLAALVLASLSSGLLTACSAGFEGSGSSLSSMGPALTLSPGALNQAPRINCRISNPGLPGEARTINTLSEMDTFFTENPRSGDTLTFNCLNTLDEGGAASVQFFVDPAFDPDAPDWQPLAGAAFSLPLAAAGSFPMALRAVDAEGTERVKTFTMVVTCPTVITPQLDPAGVSVAATGQLNYFDYRVASGSVSSGTRFSFSWDFNGDGVFDPYSLATENDTWTNLFAVPKIYTIFASTPAAPRFIGLKVRNECMYETSYRIPVVQQMPNIDRTPTAQATEKPFFYLQADIHGLPVTDQRVNGDYLTTQYPEEPMPRVRCDYKFSQLGVPAVFTIKGLNWYKGGMAISETTEFIQGMEVRIQGIPDLGTQGLQTFNRSNGVVVTTANYHVSAADDGLVEENYSRIDQACDVTFRLRRAVAVSPCAPDQTLGAGFVDTVLIITGEFDCARVSDVSTGRAVAANNGKFFCQVSTNNMCVGGGGGGGGGKPPPQQ